MVQIQQIRFLMLEHNNSYMVGVMVDVLCVRLFDSDEEQHVFLNVGYTGGTGKKCAVSFRFP